MRSCFLCGGLNLLPCVGDKPGHLARQLERSISGARGGREYSQIVVYVSGENLGFAHRNRNFGPRRRACSRRRQGRWLGCPVQNWRNLHAFGKCKPIFGRERNAPDVSGNLQLQRHLKELPNRPGPLNPRHPAAYTSWRLSGFRVRNLQRYPHVLQDVVLRLIPAAVAVEDQGRSALHERPPERIHTGHHKGNRLHDPRAAAFSQFRIRIGSRLRSHFNCLIGKIAACVVHTNRRLPSVFLTSQVQRPADYFPAVLRVVPSEVRLRFVPKRNIQTSLATQIGPTSK